MVGDDTVSEDTTRGFVAAPVWQVVTGLPIRTPVPSCAECDETIPEGEECVVRARMPLAGSLWSLGPVYCPLCAPGGLQDVDPLRPEVLCKGTVAWIGDRNARENWPRLIDVQLWATTCQTSEE